MSDLFQEIPDGQVILRCKGVYRQAKLYSRKGLVYAQHGTGFIGLFKQKNPDGNGTTVPSILWEDIHSPLQEFDRSPHGRLRVAPDNP